MTQPTNVFVRVIESDQASWRIREFTSPDLGTVVPISLVCESPSTMRRLWQFPTDWGRLSDRDLLMLFDIA
jgi:hypothetical protein